MPGGMTTASVLAYVLPAAGLWVAGVIAKAEGAGVVPSDVYNISAFGLVVLMVLRNYTAQERLGKIIDQKEAATLQISEQHRQEMAAVHTEQIRDLKEVHSESMKAIHSAAAGFKDVAEAIRKCNK
ncbi:MAG: hypothetical protein IMZ55_06395 [Acidobacteria bacterium]|nr:hypothetical protein [Acidobacteriota bacterium]